MRGYFCTYAYPAPYPGVPGSAKRRFGLACAYCSTTSKHRMQNTHSTTLGKQTHTRARARTTKTNTQHNRARARPRVSRPGAPNAAARPVRSRVDSSLQPGCTRPPTAAPPSAKKRAHRVCLFTTTAPPAESRLPSSPCVKCSSIRLEKFKTSPFVPRVFLKVRGQLAAAAVCPKKLLIFLLLFSAPPLLGALPAARRHRAVVLGVRVPFRASVVEFGRRGQRPAGAEGARAKQEARRRAPGAGRPQGARGKGCAARGVRKCARGCARGKRLVGRARACGVRRAAVLGHLAEAL